MEERGRILVVDDEVNACAALAELLREEGYIVETAADGAAALPVFDAFHPHVVVTDLNMPGLDGTGLIRELHERDPGGAVIVVTAYGSRDNTSEARRIGAEDCFTKPINFDALAAVLGHLVRRRAVR